MTQHPYKIYSVIWCFDDSGGEIQKSAKVVLVTVNAEAYDSHHFYTRQATPRAS